MTYTPRCELFALCGNQAIGVVDTHLHVLGFDGLVPACQRCADKLGYRLLSAEWIVEEVADLT